MASFHQVFAVPATEWPGVSRKWRSSCIIFLSSDHAGLSSKMLGLPVYRSESNNSGVRICSLAFAPETILPYRVTLPMGFSLALDKGKKRGAVMFC